MVLSARYIFNITLVFLLSLSVQATVGVNDCVKSTKTLFHKEDQKAYFFKSYEIINGNKVKCRTLNGQLQVYPKDNGTYLPQEIILRKNSTGLDGIITYEVSAKLPDDLVFGTVEYFCDHPANMPADVYILESCWVQYTLESRSGKELSTTGKLTLLYSSIVIYAITVIASIYFFFTKGFFCGCMVLTWPIWLLILLMMSNGLKRQANHW